MGLVAHCGEVNRGSYVHSLVLTDIASGWTEAAPIVVRESSLVLETLGQVRGELDSAVDAEPGRRPKRTAERRLPRSSRKTPTHSETPCWYLTKVTR
jgi:hypothetical protein